MQHVPNTLTNERTVAFVDYHNTLNALRREGRQADLAVLRAYLAQGRHLVEAFVYIATHPQPEHQAADQAALQRLRYHGFLVRTKVGQALPTGRLKCDLDMEMALDVLEFAARAHPDIVVLATGDGAFAPLAQRLRLQGIRVEVASTPGSLSAHLRASANGFIDLTRLGHQAAPLPFPEDMPDEGELEGELFPEIEAAAGAAPLDVQA